MLGPRARGGRKGTANAPQKKKSTAEAPAERRIEVHKDARSGSDEVRHGRQDQRALRLLVFRAQPGGNEPFEGCEPRQHNQVLDGERAGGGGQEVRLREEEAAPVGEGPALQQGEEERVQDEDQESYGER